MGDHHGRSGYNRPSGITMFGQRQDDMEKRLRNREDSGDFAD
jgi:hypothetical protein